MKIKIKRALISVYDKSPLDKILPILEKNKVEILSSGGTYKYIKRKGYKCMELSEFTGSPEILDGRVKTLHPKIHAGILFKRNDKKHKRQMKFNNFYGIDLVIVNFYPFKETVAQIKNHDTIIENIDVGGPAMVRAAAKNYKFVNIVIKSEDIKNIIEEMKKNNGSTSLNFRKGLSENAFQETAFYDSIIYNYLNNKKNLYPNKFLFQGNLVEKLRYGENPHQSAAIYNVGDDKLKQLGGKKLSYNNYNDIFYGLEITRSLPNNAGTVIIKHANPCGVSIENDQTVSFKKAFNCDPVSAFGGVVICNYKLKNVNAKNIYKNFFEVIVANGFSNDALKVLKRKKNLRLIDSTSMNFNNEKEIKSVISNYLFQSSDNNNFSKSNFKVVSKIQPSRKIFNNLIFAFNICRFVKSNAIVLSESLSTIGIGSGQPSRLDSCKIAVEKMKKFNANAKNVVAASDAFFPFVDGIETLIQSGVRAVIQPSGSIRDKEVIKFADNTSTVLVFSKTRHFRH